MIADFSTKPLQGLIFRQQRNTIMGLRDEDFEMCEAWYKMVLEKYDLWDDLEEDIVKI